MTSLYIPSRLKGIETRRFLCVTRPFPPLYIPSRLKGIETLMAVPSKVPSALALYIPSRLKGIETQVVVPLLLHVGSALDIPSRLKGIETETNTLRTVDDLFFVYTFPFEGNWNLAPISSVGGAIPLLWIYLPVWRELKLLLRSPNHSVTVSWLCIYLPVWRELKHFNKFNLQVKLPALYIPSRLKGIETLTIRRRRQPRSWDFVYTFPFEGNWNTDRGQRRFCVDNLWIYLPVWRELKLIHRKWFALQLICFVYTFPFEGNWNKLYPTQQPATRPQTLYIPSRLKGIETLPPSGGGVGSIGSTFVYTFPFEGNWNWRVLLTAEILETLYIPSRLKGIETLSLLNIRVRFILWIYLPVWRELKLKLLKPSSGDGLRPLYIPSRLKGIETQKGSKIGNPIFLWIYLPVWRELKQ